MKNKTQQIIHICIIYTSRLIIKKKNKKIQYYLLTIARETAVTV